MTIPVLPDAERRTVYSPSSSTGPFNVGFAIYGDSSDYSAWVEVWLDTGTGPVKLTAVTDWTLDSPSGVLANLPRPITDARVTLVLAATGTLHILGAERPRRSVQLANGQPITADTFNVAVTDLKAAQREIFDKFSRAAVLPPGQSGDTLAATVKANADAAHADKLAADADATQTGLDRVQTGLDRVQTGSDVTAANAARDLAQTYAEVAGLYKAYATKAAATADIANVPANAFIEVEADEGQGGLRTRYQKSAGVYVLAAVLSDFVFDHLGRTITPPKTLDFRSTGLRLRKALLDVSNGTRKSLRVLSIGDSYATYDGGSQSHLQIARVMAGHFPAGPIYAHVPSDIFASPVSQYAASGLNVSVTYPPTATQIEKNVPAGSYYDKSFIGSLVKFANSGEYCIYDGGGRGYYCDRLTIPLYTSVGAGTLKIEISEQAISIPYNDAGWRSPILAEITTGPALTGSDLIVNCNAAAGLTHIVLDFAALAKRVVKVTWASGTAFSFYEVMPEVRTTYAINIARIAVSSNNFADCSAAAEVPMAARIAQYDPDAIVISSNDSLAAYQNFLPMLDATLTTAAQAAPATVLLDASPSIGGNNFASRDDYMKTFVADKLHYDVIDGEAIAGGYAEMVANALNNDGVHPPGNLVWMAMKAWATQRGLIAHVDGAASPYNLSTATLGSRRAVTHDNVPFLLGMQQVVDTGYMAYAAPVAAGGSGALTAAVGHILLESGATAASTIVGTVNTSAPLIGSSNSSRSNDSVMTFSTRVRIVDLTTHGKIWLLSSTRAWNAAYAGDLVAEGWGFRIDNNVVKGVSFLFGTGQQLSPSSYTIGANAIVLLEVVAVPPVTGATTGTVEWFVNGHTLGTRTYTCSSLQASVRAELTNGADAAAYSVQFAPFKIGEFPLI